MTAPDHQKLYEIAEEQAGYFTAAQAGDAGFSAALLTHHTEAGRFVRVAHGLYRLVRFPHSPHEDLFVAWLRTGPHSVISHESALALYELADVLPDQVHVIVPRTASRRREGLQLHTHQIESDEVTRVQGLPVTTPARTIADVIVAGLGPEQVEMAVKEALRRGLTTEQALVQQMERRGGRTAELLAPMLEECAHALQ